MQFDLDEVLQRLLDEAYRLLAAAPLLLLALLIAVAGWLLASWLSRRAFLARLSSRNPFLRDLTRTTVRWVIFGVALLVALEVMDATALVGAVLGTAGVMGVALGFAFKDTLENYLAGLLMSLRQPFAPRDHVVIDGNEGLVVAMTSRATILMTPDGNHLRLPNALVFRSVTLNYTRNPSRRFQFDVGVGASEDLLRAQQIGVDELGAMDGVMIDPPPRSYISSLADSSVMVRYHGWVDQRQHDFQQVKSEAIRRVKQAIEAAGMDLPEPIYRVRITERGTEAAAGKATKPLPGSDTSADTRAQHDMDRQVQADRLERESQDLLDPNAPQE